MSGSVLNTIIAVKISFPGNGQFYHRARKEITSAFETARKLPRFDRSQGGGGLVNTSPLAIVEPRGFGAVSNWEVISLRALRLKGSSLHSIKSRGKKWKSRCRPVDRQTISILRSGSEAFRCARCGNFFSSCSTKRLLTGNCICSTIL